MSFGQQICSLKLLELSGPNSGSTNRL